MIFSSASLLVFSAFLHALWNAFLKKSSNKDETLLSVIFGTTLLTILLCLGRKDFHLGTNAALVPALCAGIGEGCYLVAMKKSLDRCPLGKAYLIMRGGAMIYVWLVSILFFGEQIHNLQICGVAVVFLGLVLSQQNAPLQKNGHSTIGRYLWPHIAALCVAIYHLAYGRAQKEGAHALPLFAMAMTMSLPFLIVMSRNKIRSFSSCFAGKIFIRSLPAAVICGASFLIFLWGLRNTEAGLAITLRNTSVVFAQIFAYLLGEKIAPAQWIGALLVTIGSALAS